MPRRKKKSQNHSTGILTQLDNLLLGLVSHSPQSVIPDWKERLPTDGISDRAGAEAMGQMLLSHKWSAARWSGGLAAYQTA